MIVAARNIFKQIIPLNPDQTQRPTIFDMLNDEYKDHQIIVTGHSLGAGTAVILGLLLRSEKTIRNRLKVYAYGVPGGLLNKPARDESMKFMVSVIHNDDVISRLSIRSIVRLRNEVRKTLLECKEPKYKIINTGFCAALGAIGKCCFGSCCCCFSFTDEMAGEVFKEFSRCKEVPMKRLHKLKMKVLIHISKIKLLFIGQVTFKGKVVLSMSSGQMVKGK